MNRFSTGQLQIGDMGLHDALPSFAFVYSACWWCILPVDCIAHFNSTFVSHVLAIDLSHWRGSTSLGGCYCLINFLETTCWPRCFNIPGDRRIQTNTKNFCTCSIFIGDACFEDKSPIVLRFQCCWICPLFSSVCAFAICLIRDTKTINITRSFTSTLEIDFISKFVSLAGLQLFCTVWRFNWIPEFGSRSRTQSLWGVS